MRHSNVAQTLNSFAQMNKESSFRDILFLSIGIFFLYSFLNGIAAAGPLIIPSFQGNYDPFLALFCNYSGLLITAILSPPYSYLFSTKSCIVFSACNLLIYGILSLVPQKFVTYWNNFQSGFNAGVMWTSVGKAISVHSDITTINQNVAVLFFFLKGSVVLANFLRLVFFKESQIFTHIFQNRSVCFVILEISIGFFGLLLLCLYKDPKQNESDPYSDKVQKKKLKNNKVTIIMAFEEITDAVRLCYPEKILLLMHPMFFLDGMTVEFWRTLTGTAIDRQQTSHNLKRQAETEFYLDIAALLVALGEILAACLRFLAPKCMSWDFLSTLFLCCMGTALYFSTLMLLQLVPIDSDLWEPTERNLDFSNHLTAFCFIGTNVFFGIYDCLIETHLFVSLAVWFPGSLENNQAFAVYQYICTIGGVVMVLLYKTLNIPWVIAILAFNFLVGAICMMIAERRTKW